MNKKVKKINEELAELADIAERDHEVQMARSDLYKLAKYSIKLHDMLKRVSEETGIEGWQQSKITKAADYISSVYHSLDYDMNSGINMPLDSIDTDSDDVYKNDLKYKLESKVYKR